MGEEYTKHTAGDAPALSAIVSPVVAWYYKNRRALPWREGADAYRIWVSEIMLQQTRVEAVKPYFARFLSLFPDACALAKADEATLLKAWEGLGYYNRVRNMQKAARILVEDYGGQMPADYDKIRALPGIGDYTAGAIASIAFSIAKPAADGNVFRVLARLLEYKEDIAKEKYRKRLAGLLGEIVPADIPGDFNQAMIELGAIVCIPHGDPKCESCPLKAQCMAQLHGTAASYPVKKKPKARIVEQRTVLIFSDAEGIALCRRPDHGLLAGMYELPSLPGWTTKKETIAYCSSIGLAPVRIERIEDAKHVFSHLEWHMRAYLIRVDELEKDCKAPFVFAKRAEIETRYAVPSAFSAYRKYM